MYKFVLYEYIDNSLFPSAIINSKEKDIRYLENNLPKALKDERFKKELIYFKGYKNSMLRSSETLGFRIDVCTHGKSEVDPEEPWEYGMYDEYYRIEEIDNYHLKNFIENYRLKGFNRLEKIVI